MAVMRTGAPRRGLSTVEAALVLPLVLLLTMGLLEYGWMFLMSQYITNAARQGARVAVIPDATGSDFVNALGYSMDLAGIGDVEYEWSRTFAPVEGIDVVWMVTVTVSVDYSEIGLGLPLVPTPQTLKSRVTMAMETP